MMRYLIALLLAALATIAFAAPPRVGIQLNLPVYVRAGVFTQSEADAIQARINQGLLTETFVRAGEHGRNYWVTQSGQLRSKEYAVEALDTSEDLVRGRYARTDGCHIWFGGEQSRRSCDNLFVPTYSAPPAKVEIPQLPPEMPRDTINPIPLPVPPPVPIVIIQRPPLARLCPGSGPQLEEVRIRLQPPPPTVAYYLGERAPFYGGIRLPSEDRTEAAVYLGYYNSSSVTRQTCPTDEPGPCPGPIDPPIDPPVPR